MNILFPRIMKKTSSSQFASIILPSGFVFLSIHSSLKFFAISNFLLINFFLRQRGRFCHFIWICEYMKLSMTLRLFKSLFKLDDLKNKPFITFSSINGSMVIYPELNDLKNYEDKIIWVRVPKSPGQLWNNQLP